MADLAFTFEQDRHLYRNAAGLVRPGVTSSLTAQGVFDFSMVPPDVLERARLRGKNVHRWCAEYDWCGFIDETWIAVDEMGYFQAWLNFRRDIKPIILAVEQPMLGLIGGIEVGGTPDVVAWIGTTRYVIDRKCCASRHPGWALQTADYEMLITGRKRLGYMGRMSVQLMPTGKYAITLYGEDESDAAAAAAAVVLTEWDGQANDYNADHARETLAAWKHNHRLKAA
jgi:hypothetical protein